MPSVTAFHHCLLPLPSITAFYHCLLSANAKRYIVAPKASCSRPELSTKQTPIDRHVRAVEVWECAPRPAVAAGRRRWQQGVPSGFDRSGPRSTAGRPEPSAPECRGAVSAAVVSRRGLPDPRRCAWMEACGIHLRGVSAVVYVERDWEMLGDTCGMGLMTRPSCSARYY